MTSQVGVRVSGRARCGSMTVLVSSFSRCGQRLAATVVCAAVASGFFVFTTINDRAAAVVVFGKCPDQRGQTWSGHSRQHQVRAKRKCNCSTGCTTKHQFKRGVRGPRKKSSRRFRAICALQCKVQYIQTSTSGALCQTMILPALQGYPATIRQRTTTALTQPCNTVSALEH